MEMGKSFFFLLYAVFFLSLMGTEVNGCGTTKMPKRFNGASHPKLFVFGDSYADTGNLPKTRLLWEQRRSWDYPYGSTFPHRPTGRFSNGRLLTDFVEERAGLLTIKSPIPYKYRKVGYKLLPYGMNFAVAGTGVFDTGNHQRNLSLQIDTFEEQIKEGIFSKCDLKASVALVAISGNDYSYYSESGGVTDEEHVRAFIHRVVGQLKSDVKRIHELGVPKVVVDNMHPMECTPELTRQFNYTTYGCSVSVNFVTMTHNNELNSALKELDGGTNTSFLALDLHEAMWKIIFTHENGARKFAEDRRPCCAAKTSEGYCGQVDGKGVMQYTICQNPDSYFYWDAVHPTQAGWAATFEFLKAPLRKFLSL